MKNTNSSSNKYDTTQVGELTLGPTYKVVSSIVKYRDHANRHRWHSDFRVNLYDRKKLRYFATKKGVSIRFEQLVNIAKIVGKLTDEIPEWEDGMYEVGKVSDGPRQDIVVSLFRQLNGEVVLDIREHVNESSSGFSGFTFRGFRVKYHNRKAVILLMLEIYEKMEEEYKKNPEKYEDIDEDLEKTF